MDTVYVFISTGRFRTFEAMREYIDETYPEVDADDDDEEPVPSPFMEEVGLSEYEPMCIEAVPSPTGSPIPLFELLAPASYSAQWLPRLDGSRLADAAICVFAPNVADHPENCSLEYLGAFEYRP